MEKRNSYSRTEGVFDFVDKHNLSKEVYIMSLIWLINAMLVEANTITVIKGVGRYNEFDRDGYAVFEHMDSCPCS